jgi:hypothetical protein
VLESTKSKILMRRSYRFIVGFTTGIAIGAVLVSIFSGAFVAGSDQFSIAGVVLSIMTYSGFALALFGYFYKKGGRRPFMADFLLGVGIGLILVWFVAAGNGSISNNGILY